MEGLKRMSVNRWIVHNSKRQLVGRGAHYECLPGVAPLRVTVAWTSRPAGRCGSFVNTSTQLDQCDSRMTARWLECGEGSDRINQLLGTTGKELWRRRVRDVSRSSSCLTSPFSDWNFNLTSPSSPPEL